MSVNKIILVGRLGRDPEAFRSQNDMLIVKFSLATDRVGKKGETDWHQIVTFGRTAEICQQYLSKGRQVYIEGRIQYRSYEKDGVKQYFTEIIGDNVQFLGTDRSSNFGASDVSSSGPVSAMDDDIPF